LTLGRADDSFVAFSLLSEEEAPLFRRCLGPDTDFAVLLPALNFDPPEDHTAEPDFAWAPILINDFSDINEDIGTTACVTHGDFDRLLRWQPPVDITKTSLIAIVAPGPFNRTKVAENSSLPILGQKLMERGYGAVGIYCKSGSDEEFVDATSYAACLAETSGLPILHVARNERDIGGTSFSVSVRQIWSTTDP
jgi:hypothetical protein